MKKFVAGLVIGLLFAAVPARTEWDMLDFGVLKEIRTSVQEISSKMAAINGNLTRLALATERIASSLERNEPRKPAERAD